MAQKTSVTYLDDLDGTEADFHDVQISLDGVEYELDLSAPNKGRLDAALADFIAAARRVGGRRRHPAPVATNGQPTTAGYDAEMTKRIRDWGRSNGFNVSDRGRVSKAVTAAYEAHQADLAARVETAAVEDAKPATRAKRKRRGPEKAAQ